MEQFYDNLMAAKNKEKTRLTVMIGDFNAKIGQREIGDPAVTLEWEQGTTEDSFF